MIERSEAHLLTGAYVVDALDPDERVLFEAHLRTCEECRLEVAGLQATAARLGLAAASAPPPGLRDSVLARARTVRQESPSSVVVRGSSARWRDRRVPLLAAAAALLAVALVGTAGLAWTQHRANDRLVAESERISAVLAAPDATSSSADVANGGRATVVSSRAQDAAVFIGSGLAQVAAGRTYELWFIDASGTARAAGTFTPTSGGSSTTELAGSMGNAALVGVTVEPSGGSTTPTTKPVVALRLRST